MINWIYYPKSQKPPEIVRRVVGVFESVSDQIDSEQHDLKSNEVLECLRPGLESVGFEVERGKKKDEKIHVPVLFGRQGQPTKSFEADAYSADRGLVLEVEAGRGVTNNQFLKDLFQGCMMHGVQYLGIAVRNRYRRSKDFERMVRFLDTLYASQRMDLPLKGLAALGY